MTLAPVVVVKNIRNVMVANTPILFLDSHGYAVKIKKMLWEIVLYIYKYTHMCNNKFTL